MKRHILLLAPFALFSLAFAFADGNTATPTTNPFSSEKGQMPRTLVTSKTPKGGAPAELVATSQPTGENLVPNSGFEEPNAAGDGPNHWQGVDNLVYFWTTDPSEPERGKVLKIDTDIIEKQAYDWWIKRYLYKSPLKDAPPKIPPTPPKYDTIGGNDGGFYWSDYIPIKEGKAYKVYIDAKGPASQVFIRGYVDQVPLSFADESPAVQQVFRHAKGDPEEDADGRPIRYRMRYIYSTWFAVGGSDQWKTYTHLKPRHPTSREITKDVRYIRIMIYPFWPCGEYFYDNVKVVEVDADAEQAMPSRASDVDKKEMKVIK